VPGAILRILLSILVIVRRTRVLSPNLDLGGFSDKNTKFASKQRWCCVTEVEIGEYQ